MQKKYKIFYALAAALALVSWLIAIIYWDRLPQVMPVHFGIDGQADGWADKSLFYAFLIPTVQTIMLGLFVFLYYKPQYSNIPTTMWLMALDKKQQDHAFGLIRKMHVGVAIWIGLLFTYLTYGMNASAVNNSLGLSPGVMMSLIGLMLLWLVYWTIKIYAATKEAIRLAKNNNKKGGKK